MTKTGDSRAARAPAPKGFLVMPLMTPILVTYPRHQLRVGEEEVSSRPCNCDWLMGNLCLVPLSFPMLALPHSAEHQAAEELAIFISL